VWVNNQVEPTSVQPTKKSCGNNRFHKSGDLILILNMVKSHFSFISCTDVSEYVLRRYDIKQMALGEPKHALSQSLESVHI
jgi:hypothetical protein